MDKVQFVKIPMFAQIESLNVSVAASIVMYEFVRQAQSPSPSEVSLKDLT
jgi:tRNA G18 (ribose-2'-O)-methylase SpoU